MSRDSIDSQPLLPTTSTFEKLEHNKQKPTSSWRRNALVATSFVLNVALALGYVLMLQRERKCEPQVYSPAQDVLEYVPKTFDSIWDKSIYNAPPSPDVDEAWEILYSFGVMQIPKSQAALLPNRTAPIPGDEQNYILTFDVFHQLHCLNMIRQALYPEYYDSSYYMKLGMHSPLNVQVEGHEDFDHTAHCIDSLRETLTCTADLTPILWTWDNQHQRSMPTLESVNHVCRNYERIVDWAKAHTLRTHFNATVHIEDDLKFPKLE